MAGQCLLVECSYSTSEAGHSIRDSCSSGRDKHIHVFIEALSVSGTLLHHVAEARQSFPSATCFAKEEDELHGISSDDVADQKAVYL
jgi:hypothetical protein